MTRMGLQMVKQTGGIRDNCSEDLRGRCSCTQSTNHDVADVATNMNGDGGRLARCSASTEAGEAEWVRWIVTQMWRRATNQKAMRGRFG